MLQKGGCIVNKIKLSFYCFSRALKMIFSHGFKKIEKILFGFLCGVSLAKETKWEIFFRIDRVKSVFITFNVGCTGLFHCSHVLII